MGEDPEDGGEAEEESGDEGERSRHALCHFFHPERRSGEGREDVEAGEADESAEGDAEEGLQRCGPELFVEGKTPQGDSKNQEAEEAEEEEFSDDGTRRFALADFLDEIEGAFEETFEEVAQAVIF